MSSPHEDPEAPEALGGEGLGLLLRISALLQSDMDRDLAARGLSASRVPVLWILGELGPSTQRTLADRLGVSARNVTGLVDGLAATGFVTREPHPGDGRAFLVTATERGEREVASLRSAYDELAGHLFGDIWPGRLATLVEGLRDVADELEAIVEDAADEAAEEG